MADLLDYTAVAGVASMDGRIAELRRDAMVMLQRTKRDRETETKLGLVAARRHL
jgi:hypothetical protein